MREIVKTREERYWVETCDTCGEDFRTYPAAVQWGGTPRTTCSTCTDKKNAAAVREKYSWLIGATVTAFEVHAVDIYEIHVQNGARFGTISVEQGYDSPSELCVTEDKKP